MKAVIFGLGGVLVDSETHWHELQMEYITSHAPKWSQEDMAQTVGVDVHTLHKMMHEKDADISIGDLKAAYDKIDEKVYGEQCELLPGAVDLLCELKEKGVLIALVTSTRKKNLETIFKRFPIQQFFTFIQSADDTWTSKPNPEVYVTMANKLNLSPRECVVIEDADSGVRAARDAGMLSVGIAGTKGQTLDEAQLVVKSMDALSYEVLMELHRG